MFAYGQTGSGKSYSIVGAEDEERGLMPRILEGLFDSLSQKETEGYAYETLVSYLEIYNESLRDLLDPNLHIALKLTTAKGEIIPKKRKIMKNYLLHFVHQYIFISEDSLRIEIYQSSTDVDVVGTTT